ncbi:hypothetical protein [Pseudobacillus wudalianchiensis]|uniref:hypothetical protein n=1 Tax=Pseudobacillus wudalianchiensis TaxID=1743143 RepID=UPI00159F2864|nr:hypothetical protein [Bacillus wudalianchiensis]
MKKGNNNESSNVGNGNTSQDEIMNRVNQTFDEMVQEVRSMINDNNEAVNREQSERS